MKTVLIAHQSAVPHYRIPFYNTLERLRPSSWRFDVVFDPSESESRKFFQEQLVDRDFRFPVLEVKTLSLRIPSKTISYQTFWRKASRYDLVIVENAVNNLTYPLCHLHQLRGTRIAYWGHGKDRSITKLSVPKAISETLKIFLARRADGFFAYTAGVELYLARQGLSPERIFVVNNTTDINEQRRAFGEGRPNRMAVRQELGLEEKKVLLFVGRFTQNKRIGFLLKSFSILHELDASFHLLLVGSGGEPYLTGNLTNVTYFGPIVELDRLAPLYVASDVFACPGSVGLGPLQALCYDLPVITIDSATHGPEIQYLTPKNSVVLATSTTPVEYAQAIVNLFRDSARLDTLRANIWSSIEHLTIEQMAQNFVQGVNTILGLKTDVPSAGF
jgi:L-malate glycosyltransferase